MQSAADKAASLLTQPNTFCQLAKGLTATGHWVLSYVLYGQFAYPILLASASFTHAVNQALPFSPVSPNHSGLLVALRISTIH
jgi:hypothetical protein